LPGLPSWVWVVIFELRGQRAVVARAISHFYGIALEAMVHEGGPVGRNIWQERFGTINGFLVGVMMIGNMAGAPMVEVGFG